MRSRPLGSTGLVVSEIGLGLAAVGRPGYINLGHDADIGADKDIEVMRRRATALLDRAFERGVRYFDAARSYGRAEEFLASWLEGRSRSLALPLGPDDVTIGSKWGYRYVAGWRTDVEVHEVKDHSVGAFREQYAETRSWLDGWLDLYQIHSAVLETGVLEDREVLASLVGLADDGVVAGLSVSGPAQGEVVRMALEAEVDGVNPFRCVQATWNVLEPSAGPALAEAAAAGWGVIVKEAVANGRLSSRGVEFGLGLGDGGGVAAAIAERHGVGIDAVALAAVLAQPWVGVVLSGAASLDQLDSNLAAASVELDANKQKKPNATNPLMRTKPPSPNACTLRVPQRLLPLNRRAEAIILFSFLIGTMRVKW
ncbi:MAG: aldo/keto reductase [Acidimicrobiales bacterium]